MINSFSVEIILWKERGASWIIGSLKIATRAAAYTDLSSVVALVICLVVLRLLVGERSFAKA
jgi:hypothetical protein